MLSVILFFFSFGAKSFGAVEVRLLQDNPFSKRIEFKVNDYEIHYVQINGERYSKIMLPNTITWLKRGYPELPRLSRSIIIPNDAHMNYRIITSEYETRTIPPVIPSKGNLTRNINPDTVPYTFNEFYQLDEYFPKETIELHEPFILRDFRGITVQFNPFQYNPKRQELRVCKKIIVEVYPDGPGMVNVKTKKIEGISKDFSEIYSSIFLNFPSLKFDTIPEKAGRMLIISADSYYDNVIPLRDWKREKGIPTKLVKYSDVGTGSDDIKAYIQNEYDTDGVTFILLVGDAEDIPPATGTAGSASGETADPCYTYLEGGDYFPDAFISRLSANNTSDVDNQVTRFIEYERNPQPGADWYHLGTGIASNEGSPTDRERCGWLRDSLLFYTNYTEIDEIYDPGATASQVKSALENGRSIVNYIGHGSETSWGTTGFSNSDVNGLMNPDMLPFIISVACVNGQFVGGTCFGESWLRAGSVGETRGAIAFYGSSILQSWVPPTIGQMQAVRLLCHGKVNTVGGYMFNGSCGMIEEYLPGNQGVEMFQTWHIFGDCSVQMRTNIPISISVSYPPVIPIGPYNLRVNVSSSSSPVEDALVAALVDTLPVSGYTDAGGDVTLSVSTSKPDTVQITVTGYNLIPYEGYTLSGGKADTLKPDLKPQYHIYLGYHRESYKATKFTVKEPCYVVQVLVGAASLTPEVSKDCNVFIWEDEGQSPTTPPLMSEKMSIRTDKRGYVYWNAFNLPSLIKVDSSFWVGTQETDTLFPTLVLDTRRSLPSKVKKEGGSWADTSFDWFHGAVVVYFATPPGSKIGSGKVTLNQNYPNPVVKETMISYTLPKTSRVKLNVYDVAGRLVRTLVDEIQEPGFKEMVWDRKNGRGKIVSSGIYFCKLIINDSQSFTRLIVVL